MTRDFCVDGFSASVRVCVRAIVVGPSIWLQIGFVGFGVVGWDVFGCFGFVVVGLKNVNAGACFRSFSSCSTGGLGC